MKRCPTCNRTYNDDALSYCLDDGTPLLSGNAPSSFEPNFDPNATISLNQPVQPPTIAYRPDTPLVNQAATPAPSWSPTPAQAPPQRKRRVWPWVMVGLIVVVLIGGGLIAVLIGLASMGANANNSNSNKNSNLTDRNSNRNTNSVAVNKNSNAGNNNGNANANSGLPGSFRDDFSVAKWGAGNYPYGSMWYANNEYHMHAMEKGYIVMYGPDNNYSSENATVKATARSVDGKSPDSGYGLVVQGSKSSKGELQDYAFLIYTGDNAGYSIAMHHNGAQTNLVPWTRTSVIRTGTTPNQLEVRVNGKQLAFYINGQYITTITDNANLHGTAGFYTSGTNEVAFDDLEIYR